MTSAYSELLLRPDLGKRAYRLRCRFSVGAFPKEDWLGKAKVAAAEKFIEDMAKHDWHYLEHHGIRMTGPFAAMQAMSLPPRHQQEKWHWNARMPFLPRGLSNDVPVVTVPSLDESDKWEYELAAVFVHDTILTESPDPDEERAILKTR